MTKRPISITFVGWLFILAGAFGIAYHATEFKVQDPFEYDLLLALFVRPLAVLGGAFTLRGANWARWLLLAWIGYHVILSTSHAVSELVIHCVIFAGVAYFLFHPRASEYFRGGKQMPQNVGETIC